MSEQKKLLCHMGPTESYVSMQVLVENVYLNTANKTFSPYKKDYVWQHITSVGN